MTNNIYGFPYLCIDDYNARCEHMVSHAFSCITQTLCCIDTLRKIKCTRLAILGHADSQTPLCAPKAKNFWQYEDYKIFLTYSKDSWCQMIYQLSHEVNHIIMGCAPVNREYQWIAEVLCEMASLIVLKKLASQRQTEFFPESSAAVFQAYLDSYQRFFSEANLSTCQPDQYLLQYASTLSDPEYMENGIRKRNGNLALWLVNSVPFSRNAWKAVTHIRQVVTKDKPSYSEFLIRWGSLCRSAEDRLFVNAVLQALYPAESVILCPISERSKNAAKMRPSFGFIH